MKASTSFCTASFDGVAHQTWTAMRFAPVNEMSRSRRSCKACCSSAVSGSDLLGANEWKGDRMPSNKPSYQVLDPATGNFLESEQMPRKPQLMLSWAGAGIFFFWQLGAMKYLAERYDLKKTPMVGASGGALAAVLALCGLETDYVVEHALELSVKHGLQERSLGLLGALGPIVEEWLDDLLPENAHELCRGKVTVVVTTLPDMKQVGISDFRSKADLIDACMASSHIPLVLDMKLMRSFRGKPCIDGSVPDFFYGNCDLLTQRGGAVVFDYFDDSLLERKGRMDMLELKSFDEIRRMYRLGYDYAHKLHAEGKFGNFHLEEVLLTEAGHMQEVMSAGVGAEDPALP